MLFTRGGVCWARARVGDSLIRKSMGTRDAETAKDRHEIFMLDIKRLRDLRRRSMRGMPALFKGPVLASLDQPENWPQEVEDILARPKNEIRAMYAAMRSRTKKKGYSESMEFEDLVGIWLASGGVCAVTGIRFDNTHRRDARSAPWKASLDRKIPARGYLVTNCRLVCNSVNYAMMDFGEGILLAMLDAMQHKIARSGHTPVGTKDHS